MPSITDLRATMIGLGLGYSFGDSAGKLQQMIDLHGAKAVEKLVINEPPPLPDDQLLRTKTPAKSTTPELVREYLLPYTARGMHLTFSGDTWHIQHGIKENTGTLRQPLRVIVQEARKLMTDTVGD